MHSPVDFHISWKVYHWKTVASWPFIWNSQNPTGSLGFIHGKTGNYFSFSLLIKETTFHCNSHLVGTIHSRNKYLLV